MGLFDVLSRNARSNPLLGALAPLIDHRQQISDAYWSLTHPIDRLQGEGRAENQMLAFPLGGRYAPRTPGLRAEALQAGDMTKMLGGVPDLRTGELSVFEGRVPQNAKGERFYHLKNEDDEIVASATR